MLVSKNNMFRAIMQYDGNFVVYDNLDKPIWASKTDGKGGKILTMQADNNLVIYKGDGKAVWSAKSNKENSQPQLIMQNDQNLVIYNLNDGKACWSINKGKPKDEWKWATNNWMQQSYDVLQNLTLKDFCIPGSHDAGMYYRGTSTSGAFDCNVLTQSVPIYDQLVYGFRYFDIRPIYLPRISEFRVGHFTDPIKVIGVQGACSVDINKVIEDVNNYTKHNNELIILNLSHDLNLTTEKNISEDDWRKLLNLFKTKLNNLLVMSHRSTETEKGFLLKLKVSEFINSKSAVVVIVPDRLSDSLFNELKYQGFYRLKSLDLYDEYSNTNNLCCMINDQKAKLIDTKVSNPNKYFLLSWTLTQTNAQAVTCKLPGVNSIKDLANKANKRFDDILPTVIKYKPNVFYIDDIKDNKLTTFIIDNINPKKLTE